MPTWSVRDYGNRVGVFRLMRVLDRYRFRATVALNSDLCAHHPVIIEEGLARQWEWMGHNESNARRLNELPEGEEPRVIRNTLDTIERATGQRRRPAGLVPACKKLGTRSTISPQPAATMSPIGRMTISPM